MAALAALAAPSAYADDSLVDVFQKADGSILLQYASGSGEANDVEVRTAPAALDPAKRAAGILGDTAVAIKDARAAGFSIGTPLCDHVGGGVSCTVPTARVALRISTGDGNDRVSPRYDSLRELPTTVYGGPGNDALQMVGADPTSIDFSGGPGVDGVSYFDASNPPFAISDDGLANDGVGHDNIRPDVELYVGGDGNDRFAFTGRGRHVAFGSLGNDTFAPGPGPDLIDGGYGGNPAGVDGPSNDTVTYAGRTRGVTVTLDGVADDGAPGEGDEVLPTIEQVVGTSHDDTIVGSTQAPADDRPYTFEGGAGNDTIGGGYGSDTIRAGSGDDTVIALGGGHDHVDCGPGRDVAVIDAADPATGCERVLHSYVQAASRQTGSAVTATVAVPAPGSVVTAILVRGKRTVGRRSVRLPAGLRSVRVKLSRAGRKVLHGSSAATLALRVRIAPPGRDAVTGARRVALKKR